MVVAVLSQASASFCCVFNPQASLPGLNAAHLLACCFPHEKWFLSSYFMPVAVLQLVCQVFQRTYAANC